MSDRPESLAAALAELQQHLPRIGKDAQGQRSRYASLEEINRVLLPLLGVRGFSFTCGPTMLDGQFVLEWVLRWDGSDEKIEGFYPLPSSSPQTMGGAITYGRRYCLLAVTGATQVDDPDDDDAQAAEQAARAQRRLPPEVREDGSMTEAEQERQARLGPEPGAWRSTGTAENDDFYDGSGPPLADPPETAWGSASGQQKTRMFALFGGLKMREREKQIAFIEEVVGVQVNSRNDLSFVQADQVIAELIARSTK